MSDKAESDVALMRLETSKPCSESRPIRPGFAEDVYGQGRVSSQQCSSSQTMGGAENVDAATPEMCGSALAQRRSANLPKLKELCAGGGSTELNISSMECPLASARASQMGELDFQYADSDSYNAELAELYTYSEMDEFALNFECFGRYMREREKEPIWNDLHHREKCKILNNLVASLESVDPEQRLDAARVILYILQGAYGDFADLDAKDSDQWSTEALHHGHSANTGANGGNGLDVADRWFGHDQGTGGYETDCLMRAAHNAYLVYEQGLFQPLCLLLLLESALPFERHADHSRQSSVSNSRSASHMDLAASSDGGGASGSASGTLERRRSKRSATLADNERIRVAINCLYHLVETIRREDLLVKIEELSSELLQTTEIHHRQSNTTKHSLKHLSKLRRQFLSELEEPLEQNKEPLLMHLLDMMPSFVHAKTPHYPIKKVLLLCWKVLLAVLGGVDWLRTEKERRRKDAGLGLIEDTIQVAIQMKPVLNCGGATGGLLGLSGGMCGVSAAGGRNDTDGGIITGQLGRKVRSIHHPIRPFNRQVACSSNPGQDTPTTQGRYHRERSNAFSQDNESNYEDDEDADRREENKQLAEEVDEAIVGADEEREEPEPAIEEEGGDLLDQVLEELSSASDEEKAEVQGEEDDRRKGTSETVEGGGATPQPQHFGEESPLATVSTTTTAPPKITVSTGLTQQHPTDEHKDNKPIQNADECNKMKMRMDALDTGWKMRMDAMDAFQSSHKLIMINIERQPKPRSNAQNAYTDGGDQTPKACQSPTKVMSPWPPPPPPGLPWRPKVREVDIENFLQNERQKYFDFQLPGDSTTVFGLPDPVVNGSIAALRKNLYVPLSDLQLKSEDLYNRYPFSQKEFIEDTLTEHLYARILPNMTEYVIALLKVILASLPSSKAKIDAVTILSDVLTPETDTNEMLSNSISLDLSNFAHTNVLEETVRVAIDINRHKELIIKAASSIIILLLKHLRLNHVYQFENLAQYLVLANCLPLVLKYLDQNICRYFQSKHELVPFNYPQCALHFVRNGNEWPQLTADNVDGCGGSSESPSYYLWRNVFSSINLLRVINKLTKGKQARTMMLVVYKSAPVLKRCMRAKLARYLGRQWRKTNMELISAIYMRVRHRLNDDWAYANEITRTKQFDFQREENELGMAIKRFNARRYPRIAKEGEKQQSGGAEREGYEHQSQEESASSEFGGTGGLVDDWDPKEWEPRDNSLQSALAWDPQFSERFKQNYETWLEEEVFGARTDWDSLLRNSRGLLDIYC